MEDPVRVYVRNTPGRCMSAHMVEIDNDASKELVKQEFQGREYAQYKHPLGWMPTEDRITMRDKCDRRRTRKQIRTGYPPARDLRRSLSIGIDSSDSYIKIKEVRSPTPAYTLQRGEPSTRVWTRGTKMARLLAAGLEKGSWRPACQRCLVPLVTESKGQYKMLPCQCSQTPPPG